MFHGPPDHRARLLGNGTAIMHAAPEYQPPT